MLDKLVMENEVADNEKVLSIREILEIAMRPSHILICGLVKIKRFDPPGWKKLADTGGRLYYAEYEDWKSNPGQVQFMLHDLLSYPNLPSDDIMKALSPLVEQYRHVQVFFRPRGIEVYPIESAEDLADLFEDSEAQFPPIN